jgi:hypothetical protein
VLEGSARLSGAVSVAIHPEDIIGWFKLFQRGAAEIDLHGLLPALDEVQTIVTHFLQNDTQGDGILPLNIPSQPLR